MTTVDTDHLELLRHCADHCRETLYVHCLDEGGAHTEPEHLRIMLDCIALCDAAAEFVGRGSVWHGPLCLLCAEACRACAESCDAMDDERMQECAEVCQRCADACDDAARAAQPRRHAA